MTDDFIFILIPSLFIVAFLYSSVGHGGASGYLALMAIFGFQQESMRPTALILNILVSFIAFIRFYKAGYFKFKLFLPFALSSVPAAFVGGLLTVDSDFYKKMLGILLIFPVMRLFGLFGKEPDDIQKPNLALSILIGSVIGFVSGLIGIGGGIILSPVIVLLHWANMKETAAVSALFILVNSVSGLIGQYITGIHLESSSFLLVFIAVLGGLAGSYFGVHKFNNLFLRRLLAFVLLMASIKLLSL